MTIKVKFVPGSNDFKICIGSDVVTSGRITVPDHKTLEKHLDKSVLHKKTDVPMELTAEDIYKDCRLKGFEYGPALMNTVTASFDGELKLSL